MICLGATFQSGMSQRPRFLSERMAGTNSSGEAGLSREKLKTHESSMSLCFGSLSCQVSLSYSQLKHQMGPTNSSPRLLINSRDFNKNIY